MAQEWHGMANAELDSRTGDVPERLGLQETDDDTTYARVHFSGNYGALCGEFQSFDRSNIGVNEAQQVAWSAFGMCGHTITYYDSDGNEVDPAG